MSSLPTAKKPNKVIPPPVPPTDNSLEIRIFKVLLIILAGLFIYAPAFHGGWLWDDDQEITQNAVLRDDAGLIKIWKGEAGADYFPLKSTVQWVLFRTLFPADEHGQVDSTGYHLVNVLLHLVCSFLVWKLLARLGIRGAWLGGLLFAIHPIMVESVAWVSELKNTLSLPFLLLSMMAYINFDEREKPFDYILAIVLYIAASLCKTSVIMYPVVLLLFAWWKRGTIRPKDLAYSAIFFLISAGLAYNTMHFQWDRAIADETIPVADILTPDKHISIAGILARTEIAGASILFYLYKGLLPFGLLPIYPKWHPDPVMLLAWPIIIGGLLLLWFKRNTWGRGLLFGLGFFLINLFPIIGFIKMSYMRITWTADHLIYLPMLGLIAIIAAAAGKWYYESEGSQKKWFLALGLATMLLLVCKSHTYAGIFANEYEMWTYNLRYNPDAWQAHSRLGKVLLEMGRNEEAFSHIKSSVDLRPDLAETHNNYGAMLEKKGDTEGALVQLRAAVERAPKVPIYRVNLGALLVRLGKYSEGETVYEQLLKIEPDNPTFLCNYGVALFFLGKNDQAIDAFQHALSINPNLRDARDNLATALKKRADSGGPAVPPAGDPNSLLGSPSQIKLFQ